jgi:hypothetical protein
MTMTTHPHLVLRFRMSRSYTFSPPSTFVACNGTALALAFSQYEVQEKSAGMVHQHIPPLFKHCLLHLTTAFLVISIIIIIIIIIINTIISFKLSKITSIRKIKVFRI